MKVFPLTEVVCFQPHGSQAHCLNDYAEVLVGETRCLWYLFLFIQCAKHCFFYCNFCWLFLWWTQQTVSFKDHGAHEGLILDHCVCCTKSGVQGWNPFLSMYRCLQFYKPEEQACSCQLCWGLRHLENEFKGIYRPFSLMKRAIEINK